MKLTKTEEMKIHLEEMYAEIIRLYRTIELRDKHPVDTKKRYCYIVYLMIYSLY